MDIHGIIVHFADVPHGREVTFEWRIGGGWPLDGSHHIIGVEGVSVMKLDPLRRVKRQTFGSKIFQEVAKQGSFFRSRL